jgi:O-6-methylguanine DNA methyltransferase
LRTGESSTGESSLPASCLQAIQEKAFLDHGIFRLEISVAVENQALRNALEAAGVQSEGLIRGGAFEPDTQRHHDMLLYSSLRPSRSGQGVAFIPFAKGVCALFGHADQLVESCLIHYGDPISHRDMREAADQLGLLEASGRIGARPVLLQRFQDEAFLCSSSAPELVCHAASQVADYFAGRRPVFDIPLDLKRGSDFQIKVWRLLAEIPYGTTWTYEELAHQITGTDWTAARKLARAVGSACSANPLPLILPCHRVIGKDGRLVGFSSGLDMKEYLLMHEMLAVHEE